MKQLIVRYESGMRARIVEIVRAVTAAGREAAGLRLRAHRR